ncbi:hypothetical protein [Acinetobacter indicus]|uniref:hypothetical protein n=1 Tax=Acinetobacter indicus TaxID=756892 RepID=UPI002578341C|nr:hypothetical protein [Acinetobacter indicus]MDM1772054.1 hypothetical protein [Acinetobacter indicus]MDM1774929.1 hypothetical protein [Acinetobacter indicus]
MKSKKIILSLLIYLLGTVLLLCSDFYISKNFNEIGVANWATLKSIIFVFGGVCIFGFDQILVRKPELFKKVVRRYLFQILLSSIVIGFLLKKYFIDDYNFIYISIVIFLYAFSQFCAAAFRGSGKLVEAQFFTNGWKIFTILFLLLGVVNLSYVYIFSFFLVCILGSYAIYNYEKLNNELVFPLKNQYKLGFFFLLNSLSLTMATYGEQLLINAFGNKVVSTIVFNYILAFNSFILLFVGFLGFYFVPKLKQIERFNENKYKDYMKNFFWLGFILCGFGFGFGFLIFKYYLNIEINIVLALLCLISAYVKILYIIPSAAVSLYCDEEKVAKISIFNLYNLGFYVFIFFISMVIFNEYLVHSVFLVMSMHWFLRLLNTHKFVVQALREQNV